MSARQELRDPQPTDQHFNQSLVCSLQPASDASIRGYAEAFLAVIALAGAVVTGVLVRRPRSLRIPTPP